MVNPWKGLFLIGVGTACCFTGTRIQWKVVPRCSKSQASQRASGTVEELFDTVKDELSLCTPLEKELDVVLASGLTYLQDLSPERQAQGIELFKEMLLWQRKQRGCRQSWGPLAVSALRQRESAREIIILGTPHNVPGVVSSSNPVPAAVMRACALLKPNLVAVEFDEARGLRELEKRPKGQSAVLLPESSDAPGFQGIFQMFSQPELALDEDLLQRIRAKTSNRLTVKGYIKALRYIFAKSSEKCLAMNVFALDEFRAEGYGDWGQDATAAVRAAQRAKVPILFCDLPQEWTLSKVIPIYNEEWVASKTERLKFLENLELASRFLEAEEAMIREAVMSGHGGDLPSLDFGLGLCRPATGFAEAATRRLWLEERDPVMARAVTNALEGRARVLEGNAFQQPQQRAVLQVGCCHVEGIVNALVQNHDFEVVPEPQGGWPDVTDIVEGKVPSRTAKMSRTSPQRRQKRPRAAGFS